MTSGVEKAWPQSRRQFRILLFMLIGSFSLWDFYVGNIRVFDFLGFAAAGIFVCLLSVAANAAFFAVDRPLLVLSSSVFLLVLGYSLAGVMISPDNLQPAFGMLLGV